MTLLQELSESIIRGKLPDAERLTTQALAEGIPPAEILNKGLIAGMNVVGEKFKNNEFYVPEVLIAARAMKGAMAILRPKLVETGVKPIGRCVLGTVKGDLHDIGKNLVGMMLEGAGFEVIDLGVDVSPDKFIATAQERQVQVIGLSALLTTTMVNMKGVISALEEKGARDRFKVIIGGAPVTQSYADEIGADGYAPDAASAVEVVKKLVA
ncbi:MAG: corrinoid protein [candidate division KSB1 bacterium]|nr:corrinoid protein [candidate division KSB1 bacterium]MDZ7337632.1 corrinoid protein [candidate division KSB1 bacterium]MDZ7379408.1 corrinoid protein [candidate division KSB1 bacterium]MDZ7393209.1 corrinoid protein [candidate division KSB1 bacterium]